MPCNNTVPAKIVAKMFAGERFTAYIVLPAWPEGDPSSTVSAAKLQRQCETIAMMYREMLIVDDSYIIVSSANINERSLSSRRDNTEIANWQRFNYDYKAYGRDQEKAPLSY